MGMMRLTDEQLFAYLDGGEDDPFVAEMLSRDAGARTRLELIRRVRTKLSAVEKPVSYAMHRSLGRVPKGSRNIQRVESVAPRSLDVLADQSPDEFGAMAAFLRGRAERHDLGEVRIPVASRAVADLGMLAKLPAGRHVIELGLVAAGHPPMLRVRIQDRNEQPVAGVRANLVVRGAAVQRYTTDAVGAFELPVPEAPATLRLEFERTGEIRLVPWTDL